MGYFPRAQLLAPARLALRSNCGSQTTTLQVASPTCTKLRIRNATASGGKTAEVLFAAGIREGARDVSFVELSDFEQERGAWRYVSGVLIPLAELGRPVEGLTIDVFLDLAGSR